MTDSVKQISRMGKVPIIAVVERRGEVIYYHLSKKKISYGFLKLNTIPMNYIQKSTFDYLNNIIKNIFSPYQLLNGLFKKIPNQLLKINSPNFIIAGGAKSIIKNYAI